MTCLRDNVLEEADVGKMMKRPFIPCRWPLQGDPRAEDDTFKGPFLLFQVILILTKLFDFNLGAVTESSLWR